MSLVEVIVALTMMALITIFVANLFPAINLTIKRNENRLQADTIAASILDHESARPFGELVVGPAIPLVVVEREGTKFSPELEIFEVGGADLSNVIGVRVKIRWQERGGQREVVHENWVPNITR